MCRCCGDFLDASLCRLPFVIVTSASLHSTAFVCLIRVAGVPPQIPYRKAQSYYKVSVMRVSAMKVSAMRLMLTST